MPVSRELFVADDARPARKLQRLTDQNTSARAPRSGPTAYGPVMWDPAMLAEAAAAGLLAELERRRQDQSPYGLDALSETELHPLLGEGLRAASLGVHPEQPYPTPPTLRARHRERERCDLVLTADPSLRLRDAVQELAILDAAGQTLFALAAQEELESEPAASPDEAFWLEVKCIGQFTYTQGVPGPNRTYTAELLTNAAADVVKLARDGAILHAGLLLVLFTADETTARHDLGVFIHRCLDRGLTISSPSTADFPIEDRIGNTRCTVALVPVRPDRDVASP